MKGFLYQWQVTLPSQTTNVSPVLISYKSKAVISVTATIPLHRVLREGAIKVA